MLCFFIYCLWFPVNFSYPSLEDPKPPTPPPEPKPEVKPEPQELPAPSLAVNGLASVEPSVLQTSVVTDSLADTIESIVTGLDHSKKSSGGAPSSQSPATARSFPQVLNTLYHDQHYRLCVNLRRRNTNEVPNAVAV